MSEVYDDLDAYRAEADARASIFETIESWIGGAIGLVIGALFIAMCVMTVTHTVDPKLHLPQWAGWPLLVASVLFDGWFIFSVYRCLDRRELPLGPALAIRQRRLPSMLRVLQALWWLVRVGILVVLAFRLEQVMAANTHYWGEGADVNLATVVMTFFIFGVTFSANLYMMLTISVFIRDIAKLERIWRWRLAVDVAITIAAVIFGHTAH
jgi:hypothetical protein